MITKKMFEIAMSPGDSDCLGNLANVICKHGIKEIVTNDGAQDDFYREISPLINQYCPDHEDRAGLLLKSIRLHYKDSQEHLLAAILALKAFANHDNIANYSILYSDVMNYPQTTVLLEEWAGFSYQISAPNGTSINETRLFSKHNDGLTTLNLFDIYDLVDSIDRGCGIPDTPIAALAWHLYCSEKEKYLKLLATKKNYFEIRTLLNYLDDHQLSIVAIESENKLAKIECIRRLVYFRNRNTPLPDSLYPLLSKAIGSIACTDENLFKQFLDYFLKYPVRSPSLFPALGIAMSTLNQKSRQMVVDSININLEHNDAALFNILIQTLKLHASSDVVMSFAESVFYKRQSFLEKIELATVNEIKRTNVADIIIEYLITSSPEVLFEFLDTAVKHLNEISVQWHKTETEMNARLWLALSEIKIASLALEASDIGVVQDKYLPILAALDVAIGLPIVMVLMQHTDLNELMTAINDIRETFSLDSVCSPISKAQPTSA